MEGSSVFDCWLPLVGRIEHFPYVFCLAGMFLVSMSLGVFVLAKVGCLLHATPFWIGVVCMWYGKSTEFQLRRWYVTHRTYRSMQRSSPDMNIREDLEVSEHLDPYTHYHRGIHVNHVYIRGNTVSFLMGLCDMCCTRKHCIASLPLLVCANLGKHWSRTPF